MSFACMTSEENSDVILNVSLRKGVFPSDLFQDFLFGFLQFDYSMFKRRYFSIHPALSSLCLMDLWFGIFH